MVAQRLIKPRLTDHFGIHRAQAELPFAIPFFDQDIPLYIDPFLLWKSPSMQDQALHDVVIGGFNTLGRLFVDGDQRAASELLVAASECNEVALGVSKSGQGKRIGHKQATEVLSLFAQISKYTKSGFGHIEEVQLYIDGISRDRISDLAASFLKSILIDFTIDECEKLGIPLQDCTISNVYDHRRKHFTESERVKLPTNPIKGGAIILVPKRWLRFVPWINFEDYFKAYCPQDDIAHAGEALTHVEVLNYNRKNYGVVEKYVREKERTADDCVNDPLFSQIPILSAKRHLAALRKLPCGRDDGSDKRFEAIIEQTFPSMLYPFLDFATAQARTDSGTSIRDLIMYNTCTDPFLDEIYKDFDARQIVFELKNVAEIESQHIDQINRYLAPDFSRFGVLVTRHELKRARMQQTIDLWSGQRKTIVALSDSDIAQMVDVFESRQRRPLDVVKKKYVEFRQKCPI